ncbi:nucleoprotein TPR isoform X2 [Boleophthalmus pectinirostris]|uniref:nucleoprotein TPR isoform X2 n=1 Tax=Boleophthalmus pectinirostris TaxID=150288 RepID=UPI00242D252F|nr:nucleoprotein TPR isoform X2 [Boleophthalmus pectinirostris]
MAAVLLQALERTELNKLPKGIQNKLERFVTELQNANEALKTERERLKADSEQQYFDIEKRLAETQEQFLTSTKDLQSVKEENKKLNEELSTLKGIEGESADEKTSQPQQTKTKYEIEAEKRELARLLEKRTQEVENLNEDLTRLNEKLVETNKIKMDLQLKLDEIQSSEASVQHREKRMEQEKELLQQKIDWLTSELKAKTDELLDTNREKGKQIVELQSNLQTCKEEVSRLESQLTSLKDVSESQTKRSEDLNNKLKKAKEEHCAMEEKYQNELNARIKLVSLHESTASEMKAKNNELNSAVEGLSKMVKETGEANKVLEKKVSEVEEQKTQLEAELREKIKKMEKELENVSVKAAGKHCCAQSLTEEQLDAMCPSAAAIAAIVKPGMKFFDLYNAYAECQTQLQLEKQETRRVNRVLDEIVQEVESKAPVLKRQREEYESMQRSMASLCNKLEQARSEIYSLQKEKDEAKQKCDVLEREKSCTERQLNDTSAQVCTLLMELEEARGNQIIKNEGSSTMGEGRPQQVSFCSIQELQQQNQNILKKLKELEDEKNKKQTKITSERVSELETSVDNLQKEIVQLKEQRNLQKQLADSNARQRDMYKALLTQSTGYTLPPQGPESLTQSAQIRPSLPATRSMPQRAAAVESAQTAQAKAALKQLNDSFMLYKKEKAENDRMLNETNERLRKQLSELSSRNAKLTSQLDFNIKRYDMLQENLAAYRREIAALQDRNKKMAATAQRQEHALLTMSQDLRQVNEKLALEEVRVQNLTKEKEMLRQAESRLSKEKEAILIEQRNQNLLLTNLKTIQLTMERTETDIRQRLNNKIEQLESELTAMKTKLNQEVEQRHALGRSMDAQLLEAKKRLETQNTLQQKTRELLRSSEQQVAALKAQLASAASGPEATATTTSATPAGRAVALRAPLRVHSPGPPVSQQPTVSEQELNEVKSQLRTAEEQKDELKEQLKNANATVEQYRSVVLTLEDSLKKEKESRIPLEIRLKEAQEIQKQLEQRIVEVEKMKLQGEEDRRKAVNAVEKQVIELQRTLKASQTEQQEALERCTLAVTQEEKAIQESLQQTKIAEEAQAKYEKELMLHAADVEALHDLKKRFQEISTTKQEVEDKLNKTTALLQEKNATWSTVEKQLKENLANQSRRCEELGKQNSLLHKQMDELAAATRSQQEPQQQNLDLSFSEEGKTTEQILEILRFVRREKEIAVAQFEASEGEALRYKQRVEYQNQELKELQEALNIERERMQNTAKTVAQQEQQLKKMETINSLQETNRLLKLDKDKLEHELRIFRSKVSKLQSDIAPLHQNLSALSEKNGSLQADKRILEEDLKRWKAKAQQMANQQKDGDVEEKQKLMTERDAQLKRITHLSEESAKLKTELAKANASNNSSQSQLQALNQTVARLTTERDNAKKEVETKNHDILEKNKTITQVKKIGRRYKTQYEELKAQHDKLVQEMQLLTQAQEEQKKAREELDKNKDEMQKKAEEIQKSKSELENAQKESQQTKEKLQDLQNQLNQSQNQLTQVQAQLSQTQTQLQQNQNQLTQGQKELQQAKTHSQQLQNQLKTAQTQSQTRQNQIQQIQKELQQTKENLQQKEKELQQTQQSSQQSLNQEVNNLKIALSQAEAKGTALQEQIDNLQKTLGERDAEVKHLEEQLAEVKQAYEAAQSSQPTQSHSSEGNTGGDPGREDELTKLKQELTESKNREEQLKQQMADKEEKTKKAFLGAKTKISQLNSAKEQLSKEVEELKQDKEEQEVRMNAIKSQYEMRLARLDRELRELRETQTESKEEPQDQGTVKGDQTRPSDQRQISLKSPAQDRGSSSLSEPPTANIRPTPSTPSPSSKPSPTPGSKATPRASIRPMVTPPSVPTPTPTATVMPTTQADSQEVSLGTGSSVHSTSSGLSNTPTTIAQPTSTQATAFVQPTQQQSASQEPGSSMEAERPSTSSASLAPGSKRVRTEEEDEEEDSRPESSRTSPTTKKLRLKPAMGLPVEEEEEEIEEELGDVTERPDSADSEMAFPVIEADDEDIEDEGVSQSVPSDQCQTLVRDVIVIDTDSESRESKETEKQQEDAEEEEDDDEEEEGQEDEYKDDEDDDEEDDGSGDGGMRRAEGSNEESRDADEEDEEEPSESVRSEDKPGASSTERTTEPSHSGEGRSGASSEADPPRDLLHLPPLSSVPTPSPSSLAPRLPQPRRPPHSVPPRLYIQPPAPELGPPHTQRQSSQLRRQSVGRGLQLTPGIGSTQQHFFDDDDRMVPSTPTLVVPHRNDGFAEAIHSPQVAGLSTRFRFGPPEDLLPQASASHSDLGQLASQGGLGMYESPLFLAAHDEDGGGRSVPTTPLQVAAPVTVFTESLPSDGADNMASQSVPMVTASTAMSSAADDGDEVFMEHEAESAGLEPSLDSQAEMDSAAQQSEDAALPSTSQDPDTSSATQRRTLPSQPLFSSLLGRGGRGRGEGRTLISRRGAYSRGGRGAMGR